MIGRRITVLGLPLLFASACAGPDRAGRAQLPPGQRFAAQMEVADRNAELAIARIAHFEQAVQREKAAVAYAVGSQGRGAFQPGGASAAETANLLFGPAFTAIGDYGHILGHAGEGSRITAKPGPTGTELARSAEDGLVAAERVIRITVPPEQRQAGLAGIHALADLAEDITKRGGGSPSPQAIATEADGHLAAVITLLKTVIGTAPGTALRGAVTASRAALTTAHTRLLTAARSGDAMGRYELFRTVSAMRDNDPVPGTLAALVEVLDRMRAANAALAADPRSLATATAVDAFEAAVAHLGVFAQAEDADE